ASPLEGAAQFFLYHVDAHRGERQPEDEIDEGVQEDMDATGYKVTEPDGRHRNEHEVEGMKEGPVLGGPEHDGAHEDIEQENEQCEGDGQIELVVHVAVGEDLQFRRQGRVHRAHRWRDSLLWYRRERP